jgi:hypothetical protein
MYPPATITLRSTDTADILEDLTAHVAFLQATAQEYAEQNSTSDYLNGYHKGRGTAFGQAAEWGQEIMDKLRSLLELEEAHEPAAA